jgi:hypothetical protein
MLSYFNDPDQSTGQGAIAAAETYLTGPPYPVGSDINPVPFGQLYADGFQNGEADQPFGGHLNQTPPISSLTLHYAILNVSNIP